MQNINRILSNMQEISAAMAGAVSLSAPHRSERIVTLRQDYAEECGNLLLALSEDRALLRNRGLFEELQSRHALAREKLARHQRNWQINSIDQDREGYARAASAMNDELTDFLAFVKASIEQVHLADVQV